MNRLRLLQMTVIGAVASVGLAAAPITTAAPTPQSSADDLAAQRDYLTGNGLLNRGMNELAAEEYRRFLRDHEDHAKAPNARYGLGVALFRQKLYEDAAEELARLVDVRRFEFAAETNLLLGQALLQLKNYKQAADAFGRLVDNHEEHDAADDASALRSEALYRDGQFDQINGNTNQFISNWPQSSHRERVELFDGLSWLALKKDAQAAERFEEMLVRFPDGQYAPRGTLLLGRAYQRAGNGQAAVRRYRQVLEQDDPAFVPEALYGVGVILRRSDNPQEAGRMLDRLINDHPKSPLLAVARMERGRAAFDMDEFEDAFGFFDEVDATSLEDDAAYWMAKCELRTEDFDRAASRLNTAIAEHPRSPLSAEMRYDLAIAQLRGDHGSDAIDTLRAFRRAFPEHQMAPDALQLMATTSHQEEDYEASLRYCDEFQNAYADHPLLGDTSFLAAENAFLSGDMEDATTRFEAFLGDHPDHRQAANATYRLGTALDRQGQPQKALEYLTTITNGKRTDPGVISGLLTIANIHFDAGDWLACEQAMFDYLSFGDDVPQADDALIKLGLAQHRQDKFDSALQSYDKLLDQHQDSPHRSQALFEKGQAFVASGDGARAARAFATLLTEDEDSRFAPHALNHLGAIAVEAGAYDEAATWYGQIGQYDVNPDIKAEALFQQGQSLMTRKQYGDAARTFTDLLLAHANHDRMPLARANVALCLARQDKAEEALASIENITEAVANRLSISMLTSLAYEKAWCHRALGDEASAIETYRNMLEDSDGDLGQYALVELAELEAQDKQFERAADLLRRIDLNDEDLPAELHERAAYRLGVCDYEQGEFAAAAADFILVVEAHPESNLVPSASLLCGESLFKLGKHAEAAKHLVRVVDRHREHEAHGAAMLRLGECHAHLQQWPKSEATFADYLARYEDSELWFQARFGLGWARENQGKLDEAMLDYAKVVEKHQGATAARAQFQLGECFFAKKAYSEAVRELVKVDIHYAYPEWSAAAIYEAGRCFEALAQLPQARDQFDQVVQRYPQSRWAELANERLAALSRTERPGRGRGN